MSTDPTTDANPYRPPEAPVGPARFEAPDADLAKRVVLLPRESAVRSVGRLLGLVSMLMAIGSILLALAATNVIVLAIHPGEALTLGILCLVVASISGLLGFGLARLRNSARWATLLLLASLLVEDGSRLALGIYFPIEFRMGERAAMASLAVRMGVWIYLFGLLGRPANGRVCRRDHRAMLRATSQIHCPTNRGVLVLMNVAAGIAAWCLVALLTGPLGSRPVPPAPPVPPVSRTAGPDA